MVTKKAIIEQLRVSYKRHQYCESCSVYGSSLIYEVGELLKKIDNPKKSSEGSKP